MVEICQTGGLLTHTLARNYDVMNTDVEIKLDKLRSDYTGFVGQSFNHFLCPIIFKDEDVEICKAHIINQAFPNSSRAWTVQRKDVDGFFGSIFEADFIAVLYNENPSLGDTIANKKLSRLFKPEILFDGKSVDFFLARGNIPENFTKVEFDNDGEEVDLVIKMSPEDVQSASNREWEISVSKDVRISALVSLIKSAHLSLFELLGYRYAFSVGGYYVGKNILGDFYLINRERSKAAVLINAYSFFREFAHMVRPIQELDIELAGTITDRFVFACLGRNNQPWALMVFVKISESMHAVLIPIFDDAEMVNTYLQFMQNENDNLDVALCQFEQDHWKLDKNIVRIIWPKDGILYPESNFSG